MVMKLGAGVWGLLSCLSLLQHCPACSDVGETTVGFACQVSPAGRNPCWACARFARWAKRVDAGSLSLEYSNVVSSLSGAQRSPQKLMLQGAFMAPLYTDYTNRGYLALQSGSRPAIVWNPAPSVSPKDCRTKLPDLHATIFTPYLNPLTSPGVRVGIAQPPLRFSAAYTLPPNSCLSWCNGTRRSFVSAFRILS